MMSMQDEILHKSSCSAIAIGKWVDSGDVQVGRDCPVDGVRAGVVYFVNKLAHGVPYLFPALWEDNVVSADANIGSPISPRCGFDLVGDILDKFMIQCSIVL